MFFPFLAHRIPVSGCGPCLLLAGSLFLCGKLAQKADCALPA
jgi:hypothetical protein